MPGLKARHTGPRLPVGVRLAAVASQVSAPGRTRPGAHGFVVERRAGDGYGVGRGYFLKTLARLAPASASSMTGTVLSSSRSAHFAAPL